MLLTPGAKVLFGIGVLAFALGITGQLISGDQTMLVLLLILTASAVTAAVAVAAGSRAPETASVAATVAADAPPPGLSPVDPGRPHGGGGWPALGAAALAMCLLGFVVSPLLVVAGVFAAAITLVGWLGSASSDHTGRTPNLLPIGLPVVGIFTIVSLMFFMSRVLLAVPEWASTLFALLVTIAIMGIASFLAMQPSLSGRTLVGVLAGAGVVLLVAGAVAAAIGPREEELPEGAEAGAPAVVITAKALKFDKAELALKSGGEADLEFDNDDSAVPHNVAIYADQAYTQSLFVGDLTVGPLKIEYKFPAPPPGSYFFRCDVHPFMSGKVTVS
ncbi:MAG TPA: cupredoxin domain-containing protein [Acidimicrobiales bacterium]|nr:cupredoxin domain-containing protein [Acidimicrobiales bacterium]